MSRKVKITPGSGNVFADLGLKNPDELLAKAEIVLAIARILKARKLTQTAAARLLDIDQPKISALLAGRLSGFSIERLMRFLLALDHDVEIKIRRRPSSRDHAEFRVESL